MTLYKWSQTASADATADSTINWAEGQAPSSVNDSARAMMAATAKYRDDIAGAIVTTGTSTAYAVLSYQGFDTLAHLSGQMIAFTPHATNAATVTLNVDTLGPKPLRTAPGAELASGVIIQGTPYIALYNNTDGAFYLQGMFGNPYSIPLGAGLDYWLPTAPNSSFAFPFGQAISRTAYATLFASMGNAFGGGDGSTTFNLPDKRGRVSASTDDMGGTSASRLTSGFFGSVAHPGATGGAESHALTVAEIPAHAHGNTLNDPGHAHVELFPVPAGGATYNESFSGSGTGTLSSLGGNPLTAASTTGISINNANQGGGNAHVIVQPPLFATTSFGFCKDVERCRIPERVPKTRGPPEVSLSLRRVSILARGDKL
jgi:microcystin-dependent protein